jgi:peptidyl-prolyl cis-trans isomerase B (cyclophilin B)
VPDARPPSSERQERQVSQKQHRKQVANAKRKRQQHKYDRRAARNRVIILIMAGLMALSLVGTALIGLIGNDEPVTIDDAPTDEPVDEDGADEPEAAEGPCGPTPDDVPQVDSEVYDGPFELTIDEDATYVATLETTCGDVVIELDAASAPLATNNLVNLAEDGYYDGVVFHRVIPEFVAQVGDPAGTGCGQEVCTQDGFDPDAPTFPGYTFEDELDRSEELYAQVQAEQEEAFDGEDTGVVPSGYPRGTVAMANAGPDTNGSQFFIAVGDPTFLPGPQFTVLGTVVEGLEVVDDIVASPTDPVDRPLEDVVLRTVRIEQR